MNAEPILEDRRIQGRLILKPHPMKTEYYHVLIDDDSHAATKMLSCIAGTGISLLAYKSRRLGDKRTQFTLFSEKTNEMIDAVRSKGYAIEGPYPSLFIVGDDVPGALADIFDKLAEKNVLIEESSGIANINNGYGVVLYLNEKDIDKAYAALME
jgi:aspartokinase